MEPISKFPLKKSNKKNTRKIRVASIKKIHWAYGSKKYQNRPYSLKHHLLFGSFFYTMGILGNTLTCLPLILAPVAQLDSAVPS